MSDAALKDLLREEHRRRKERSERSERGGEKSERGERSEKGSDRTERSERSERTERTEKKKSSPKYHTDREKEEKEARRREREKSDRERERERQKHREEKRMESIPIKEIHLETPAISQVSTPEISQTEKFIFVFEDDEGVLQKDISKISLTEGSTVKIFPVYLSGHNTNLTEEIVTFTNGKLTPVEENRETTWLNVIQSRDPGIEILIFDLSQIVIYNNRFFHCQDDLLDYLDVHGCEYISVL